MELHELLRKIVEVLERLRIPYLVTGSVASMAYGEPRLTNDIDIVARIDEEAYDIVRQMIKEGMPEWLENLRRYDDPSITDPEEIWGF